MSDVNSTILYGHPTNVSSPPDFFFSYLNAESGGAWGLVIAGLSFGIPMLALQNYNPRQAFAAASFNLLISVTMMAVFGIVGSFMYTLAIALVAIAVLLNRGQNGGVTI